MRRASEFSTVETFEVQGKVPPQATDMEDAVMNVLLVNREGYDVVADILTPESFYKTSNHLIYKSMQSLALQNKPIDLLTVVEELKKNEDLDAIGGPYAITILTNKLIDPANVSTYAKIVYEKYLLRQLINISGEVMNMAYNDGTDAFELLDHAEKRLSETQLSKSSEMVTIDNVVLQALKKIEEWRQNDSRITGIPCGFDEIDVATRGFQNGDFIVLAARTSTGKTAFALNVARHAAKNDIKSVPVAIWSLEMKAVQLVLRMMASESKIFLYKLQTGRLDYNEMAALVKNVTSTLSKLKIHFNESALITIEGIKRTARKLKRKNKLGMIIIDYLQLINSTPGSKSNREQVLAQISRDLKNLAQELDIPIIALAQLNRQEGGKNISWNYGPPISAIRECGAIEQDADVIIMAWGPNDEDIAKSPDLRGQVKVRLAKQRNGVLLTVILDFISEIQLFSTIKDLAKNSNKITGSERIVDIETEDDLPF